MDQEIIDAFFEELKQPRNGGDKTWKFVVNIDGVDIYHKLSDDLIGVMAEGFAPGVSASALYNFMKLAGNRVSIDYFCSDSNVIDKISPESDAVRYSFKAWPAAPRDVLVKVFFLLECYCFSEFGKILEKSHML
jgi:hypothetical protein